MEPTNVRTESAWSVTSIKGSVKIWSHHRTDTRFIYYIFALSMVILFYRCLVSYSDVGSYCFAAAACGLSVPSWIRGVQYVSGTCTRLVWENDPFA